MHSTDNVADSGGDPSNGRGSVALTLAGPTPVPVSTTSNNLSTTGIRECAGCGKRITERFLLKALDLFWHEDCLKCGCCDCRLGEVGSTLYTKANLILCKRDYLRLFGTTGYCAACNKVIPAFEMVMRAKNNVYHLECFACQQCNHRFCVGDRFYLCENKILCEYDYEERLVFANMAYNPSSLAHIRRQVSNLQPPGGNLTPPNENPIVNSQSCYSVKSLDLDGPLQRPTCLYVKPPQPPGGNLTPPNENPIVNSQSCYSVKSLDLDGPLQRPINPKITPAHRETPHNHRDDGSSGYGSPDSEIFEPPSGNH